MAGEEGAGLCGHLVASFLIEVHSYSPFIPEGRAHPSELPGSHAGWNLPFGSGVWLLQGLKGKQRSREPWYRVGDPKLPSQG